MSFDTTYRYYAFPESVLISVDSMRDSSGSLASTAPDHNGKMINTLLCGLDNSNTGKLRALELNVTAIPTRLSNGLFCLGGYWSSGILRAVENGDINATELTEAQVKALLPIYT